LRGRLGFRSGAWLRSTITHLAVIAVFGVAVPAVKGLSFFDPAIVGAYALLGSIFASPLAAPELEDPSWLRINARIVACVVYGEAMAMILLATGILTVTILRWRGVYYLPDLKSRAEAAGFGLVLSLVLSAAAVWFSLWFTPAAAKSFLRLIFVGLLMAFLLRGRVLLDVLLYASLVGLCLFAAIEFAMRFAIRRRTGLV
jgi:hypothetical protein